MQLFGAANYCTYAAADIYMQRSNMHIIGSCDGNGCVKVQLYDDEHPVYLYLCVYATHNNIIPITTILYYTLTFKHCTTL